MASPSGESKPLVRVNDLMPKKKRSTNDTDTAADLLRDLLIVELAKAKVPHQQIRKIVGCDMSRVTRIARYFKKPKKDAKT